MSGRVSLVGSPRGLHINKGNKTARVGSKRHRKCGKRENY